MASNNIFVIGAQSTGKSTIVNGLLTFFSSQQSSARPEEQPKVIHEVARSVLKTYHFTRDDITPGSQRALQLQKHILRAQFNAETALEIEGSNSWYISDRSGIDPIAYALMYVGVEAAQELLESPEWKYLENQMKSGLVVVCEAGTTWLTDDGIRLMPKNMNEWKEVDKTFRNLLEARDIAYIVIPQELRGIDDRVSTVVKAYQGSFRTEN